MKYVTYNAKSKGYAEKKPKTTTYIVIKHKYVYHKYKYRLESDEIFSTEANRVVFQVACVTMQSGSDLLTNLRNTAGKGSVHCIVKKLTMLCIT